MPASAWALAGALLGLGGLFVSKQLLRAVGEIEAVSAKYSRSWLVVSMAIGGVTGWVAVTTALSRNIALLVVVAALTLVQAPLDLLTRRLSRAVTYTALVGISTILVVEGVFERRLVNVFVVSAAAMAVTCAFALVHRTAPKALGFGDVLLVAPLTLAIAALSLQHVVLWQLVASSTAAVHGVTSRIFSGSNTIAFGPHLLLAAWLVMVVGV